MTEDERLINDTWPAIRETVARVQPRLDEIGWGTYVRAMSVPDQMEFWLLWKRVDENPMAEVTTVARQVRATL